MQHAKKVLLAQTAAAIALFGSCAAIALAANSGGGFVPLAEIPGTIDKGVPDFGTLFNSLFRLVIVVAGTLAVIKIGWGGIEYMTTEALEGKGLAKEHITNALIGLLIALGAYLILFTINPNLTFIGGVKTVSVIGGELGPQQAETIQKALQQAALSQDQVNNLKVPGIAGTDVPGLNAIGITGKKVVSGFDLFQAPQAVQEDPVQKQALIQAFTAQCHSSGGLANVTLLPNQYGPQHFYACVK